MAEKLKSILKQTRWSLLVRAGVFALAWFFLPFWLFFLIGLYLYFIPFFQSAKLFWPFCAILALSYVEPASFLFFIILGALFYYLLLIKDLLLIDRRSAYEILVLILSFLLIHDFYEKFRWTVGGSALAYGLLLAILIGVMVRSLMKYFGESREVGMLSWLVFVLVWQFVILGLFLPLDFIYQSIIVFIVLFAVIDIVVDYTFNDISRRKILVTSLGASVLLALVLASASWRI